jgi:hypothetical protein
MNDKLKQIHKESSDMDYKNVTLGKRTAKSSFLYDKRIKKYFDETIKLEHEKTKVELGTRMNKTFQRDSIKNNDHKLDLLNKVIFPSMANIIYLFEQMSKHPEIERKLRKDIHDLFGLRGIEVKRNKDIDQKYRTLLRFIRSLVDYPDNDTALHMLNIMSREVTRKLGNLALDKTDDELTLAMAGNIEKDVNQVNMYIEYLTKVRSKTDINDGSPAASRLIQF